MSTEFLTQLPPPGHELDHYDNTKLSSEQTDPHIPRLFLEAMSVREQVFVDEQSIPVTLEHDADDARSWHFLTYVSVGSKASGGFSGDASSSDSKAANHSSDDHSSEGHSKKLSIATASRVAVGTVRLVPPPHPPYPEEGSEITTHDVSVALYGKDANPSSDVNETAKSGDAGSPTLRPIASTRSTQNPHNEPYIKLGRLCILAPYRKLGLARLVVDGALEFAAQHPAHMVPQPSATEREARRVEEAEHANSDSAAVMPAAGVKLEDRWKGLVLAHAQKHLERLYHRWGFVRDDGLGEWKEDGILHVAMWKRVKVDDRPLLRSQ